jgi:DNA repair exonuclease SbcCD ATPase subunit
VRLKRLSVSGFRGFPAPQSFDLDADAVVIVGVNGQGKTSLFDGVLWGLTGTIPRLGEDARLVSMYSPSGEARVEVELQSPSGTELKITRSFDGEQQQLLLDHGGSTSRDEVARVRLLEVLWPDAAHTPDSRAALTSALTRSVYLQQDLVREFIEADSDQERFEAVSELVGAGRVTELSLALERAKAAWSRATNIRIKDLNAAEDRLAGLQVQLSTLAPPAEGMAEVARAWEAWWETTRELTKTSTTNPPVDSSDAPNALDGAVKLIDTERRAVERRCERLEELLADLEGTATREAPAADMAELRSAVGKADSELEEGRRALGAAQAEAAELRRLGVEASEARAELQALAELALRHLGETCPVCGQGYDEAETRERLEELKKAAPARPEASEPRSVSALASALADAERAHSIATAALDDGERNERDRVRGQDERARRVTELGLGSVDDAEVVPRVRAAVKEAFELRSKLDDHRASGEHLALDLTRMGERARRGELERQVDALRGETAALNGLVRSREDTGQLAGAVLEGLRNAASEVVAAQLEDLDPLLQRIYATADPHPSFRVVRLLSKIARGRGRLNAAILDPSADLVSESPEAVLSSSQMNALAVSLFLALNFGVPTLPMRAVMLDDPLQSLDDVNLLGLIDLLRRSKDQRQLLVSTHDLNFGRLLARKLRAVSDTQRTRVIELSAWAPDGPVVDQYEAPRDSELLRIAA